MKERVQALVTELVAEYEKAQGKLAHNLLYHKLKASGVAEDVLKAAHKQEKQLPHGSAVSQNTTATAQQAQQFARMQCGAHAMHRATASKMHGTTELALTPLHAAPACPC
jgi:hypothetical protein